jgi:hypothetical protein
MSAVLKENGMQMALFAKPEWAEQAKATIQALAATGEQFTADDVIQRIGLPTQYAGMNANNAVGAAVSAAARRKEITRIGFASANRASSHGRVLSVWRGASA